MTLSLELGLALALACACITNLGSLYKHRGAQHAHAVDIRRPLRTARSLLASKWFAIGLAMATGAGVLHIAAMALAPLSVVQAVLAAGVVLLGVTGERRFALRVTRRQAWGAALSGLGVALLVASVPPLDGPHSAFRAASLLGFEGVLVIVGLSLMLGRRVGRLADHRGLLVGAAGGSLFGVADVAVKALTGLPTHGTAAVLAPWLGVAIAASVAAQYASARGLQEGEAVPVIALTGLMANVAYIAGGIVVFGDPMPTGALGLTIECAGFAMVCAAAVLLPSSALSDPRPL